MLTTIKSKKILVNKKVTIAQDYENKPITKNKLINLNVNLFFDASTKKFLVSKQENNKRIKYRKFNSLVNAKNNFNSLITLY